MEKFGLFFFQGDSRSSSPRLRTRGSALAWVLGGSAILGIVSFALLTRLDTLQKQSSMSNTREAVDSTLSAVADGMLFMLQQRWCVSPNADRIVTDCNLGNSRSLERLMVSNSALINFQNDLNPIDPNTGLPLYSGLNIAALREPVDAEGQPFTTFSFSLQQFVGGGAPHPFRTIANATTGNLLSATITAKITRITSNMIPGASLQSNAAYIKFTATLTGGLNGRAEKFTYLAPRSLADYSLVTSRDMWLNGNILGIRRPAGDYTYGSRHGRDVMIRTFNRSQLVNAEGARTGGVVFESPVFINGDLVLDTSPVPQGGNPQLSPVTFAERVYLGGGAIKSAVNNQVQDFTPAATSMDFSSAIPRLGGINGVILEQPDLGADHLFNDTAYSTTPQIGRQVCMYSQEVRNTWSPRTNDSLALVAETKERPDLGTPGSPSRFVYELGITHFNGFFEQQDALIPTVPVNPPASPFGVGLTAYPSTDASNQAISFNPGSSYPNRNAPSVPNLTPLSSTGTQFLASMATQTDIGQMPQPVPADRSWQLHSGQYRDAEGNLQTQRAPVAMLRIRLMSNNNWGSQTVPVREVNVPLTRQSQYFLRTRELTQAQYNARSNARNQAQTQLDQLQSLIQNHSNPANPNSLEGIRAGHGQRQNEYNSQQNQWTSLSCDNVDNNPAVQTAQAAYDTCLRSAGPSPPCSAERTARDSARTSANSSCNQLAPLRTQALNRLECNRPTEPQQPISCSNTNLFNDSACNRPNERLWRSSLLDLQNRCGNADAHRNTIANFQRTEQAWSERGNSGIEITTRPVFVQGNTQNSPIEGGANGQSNAQPNRMELQIEFRGQTMFAESVREYVYNNNNNFRWNTDGIQLDFEVIAFDAAYNGARSNTRCSNGTTCNRNQVINRAAGSFRFHNILAESDSRVRFYQRQQGIEMNPGVRVYAAGHHVSTNLGIRPAHVAEFGRNTYAFWPASSPNVTGPIPAAAFDSLNVDRTSIERACLGDNSATMFNASNWEMSFAEQARVIMHQAPGAHTGPPPAWMQAELPPPSGHSTTNETAIPGATNPFQLLMNANTTRFEIQAIAGRCEIGPLATFVAALAICDRLIIRNRTAPLTIVGTFVVGHLQFEGDSARANIRWLSIKHPDAANLLMNAGILRLPPHAVLNRNNDALITTNLNCDFSSTELQNNPVWKPVVPPTVATKRQMCGTQSLITVQAFAWSEMNPAAGYTSPTSVRPSFRELLSRFFPFVLYGGVR